MVDEDGEEAEPTSAPDYGNKKERRGSGVERALVTGGAYRRRGYGTWCIILKAGSC